MVPSRLMGLSSEPLIRGDVENAGNPASVVPTGTINQSTDLHMFFNVLKAVRSELVRGTPSSSTTPSPTLRTDPSGSSTTPSPDGSASPPCDSDQEDDFEEGDSETKQVIRLFRAHLKGLIQVMNKLSDSSEIITRTYQVIPMIGQTLNG
jgi:hypothetical protein